VGKNFTSIRKYLEAQEEVLARGGSFHKDERRDRLSELGNGHMISWVNLVRQRMILMM